MRLSILLFLVLSATSSVAHDALPRSVLALYSPQESGYSSSRQSAIHTLVDMPLNHLGQKIRYQDINQPLPDLTGLADLRGVLVWLESAHEVDKGELLDWLHRVLDAKLKLVIVGDLHLEAASGSALARKERALFRRLGLKQDGAWVRFTYNLDFRRHQPGWLDFERRIDGVLPPFPHMTAGDDRVNLVLSAKSPEKLEPSVLIATHDNGGYIAGGYLHYLDEESSFKQYYLDPFAFFRQAFAIGLQPIPDTTTLNGQRIFYSHIDGDGWNNISLIEGYRQQATPSSRVVLEKVIAAYPDLPVTVAPIAADLDPEWGGTKEAMDIAREILAFPHVEAGSHTYSHPLDWSFFADYHPQSELAYAAYYPTAKWMAEYDQANVMDNVDVQVVKSVYDAPRSYALQPFDLEKELSGSVDFINNLLPPGKRVAILQWSGDTTPFPEAIEKVRALGIKNINGGDSRFDYEYPSYAWVAPVAWRNQEQWQVYASNSNENTYTDAWESRYFSFKFLAQTLRNTEIPYRIKPINVYYHMYSGERLSSLRAVQLNLDYARSQPISPITASHYAAIVDGFIGIRLVPQGKWRWQIKQRDRLNTLRFDFASDLSVDFRRSRGIIGQRHQHGSLYVALDPDVSEPVVALRQNTTLTAAPAEQAYLLSSRHIVRGVERSQARLRYLAEGFGDGEQVWIMPRDGAYRVRVSSSTGTLLADDLLRTDDERELHLSLPASHDTLSVTISWEPGGTSGV